MTIIDTVDLTPTQKQAIFRLWNNEYPVQLQYTDMPKLDTYLNNLTDPRHYFLMADDGSIEGWAFTFARDAEKWFAIIVDSKMKGKGYGALLLKRLTENEPQLSGWVTDHDRYTRSDGQPYRSPLDFYTKNGFKYIDGIRLEIPVLSAMKITSI